MSNFADGYAGDWLPHKDNCRCDGCSLDRAQRRVTELEAEIAGFPNLAAMRQAMIDTADENAALRAELHTWKDREAAYCPDGMAFEDYITALKAQIARLSAPVSDEERSRFALHHVDLVQPDRHEPAMLVQNELPASPTVQRSRNHDRS